MRYIVVERPCNGMRMQSDVENGIMYAVMHLSRKQHRFRFKDAVLCHEEGSRRSRGNDGACVPNDTLSQPKSPQS